MEHHIHVKKALLRPGDWNRTVTRRMKRSRLPVLFLMFVVGCLLVPSVVSADERTAPEELGPCLEYNCWPALEEQPGDGGQDYSQGSKAPTEEEAERTAKAEAAFQEWRESAKAERIEASIMPMAAAGTSGDLWTPLREQWYSYWCGPASAQIVLDYLYPPSPQQSGLANWMGTTTAGTLLYTMQDALRYFTQENYWYYVRTCSYSTVYWDKVAYTIGNLGWPLVSDSRIYAGELGYQHYISGHYFVIEAYDFTGPTTAQWSIRKNDPYDEKRWWDRTFGGNTLGRSVFAAPVFYHTIEHHPYHAVIGG